MSKHDPHGPAGYEKSDAHAGDTYRAGFYILGAMFLTALVTDIAERPLDPAEALAMVGLADRIDHFPSQLSGGEQQRVAIARALAPEPSILLADEPTGNLDLATGEMITHLIFKAQKERGMTLLLVTHDQSLAARCDRQVRMRSGQIELEAPRAKKMVKV